jgi:N-acetyl-alpha-D-glucosaminyl L-malate synthase BshA
MGMRIGLLCHRGVGGSAMVAVGLARQLAVRGHDVHVVARAAPPGLTPPPPGVTLHCLQDCDEGVTTGLDVDWTPDQLRQLADRLALVVRDHDLQVVHFHYAVPFAWVVLDALRRLGTACPAVVGTLHGTDVSVFGRRHRVRRRLAPALARLDALTTVSHHHAALAARVFGLSELPDVIPNFVDLDRFPARRLPPAGARPRIAHVSNFRPVKEPESMARIADRVLATTPAELWLVGDGEMMPEVETILDARIAQGLVRRFGVRLDVEEIIPRTDLLLVSSRMESFCLVALEAMASGVPVAAPRIGGLPELVEHGVRGLLYERGDEQGATRLILDYLGSRDLQKRLRAGALARARTLSTDVVIPRYEQMYRELLGVPATADDVAVGG